MVVLQMARENLGNLKQFTSQTEVVTCKNLLAAKPT